VPRSSLHVVPDTDDASGNSSYESCNPDGAPGSSLFESLLREASQVGSEALPFAQTPTINLVEPVMVSSDSFAPVLPIVHLGWDARPLTSAEVMAHCHLFTPQTRAT